MATKNKHIDYDKSLNWLLIVPFGASILGGGGVFLGIATQVIAAGCVGYLYFLQVRFLRQYPIGKRLNRQRGALWAAFIGPIIAATVGYITGVASFGNGLYGLGVFTDAVVGLGVALTLGFIFLFIITAANAHYIATNGGGKALQRVNQAAYVVGYIVVATVSWFTYQLVYLFHDPNTE